MTSVSEPPNYQLSQLTAFMKAEPKTLGTVQIMIGVWTFLFGIVLSTYYLTPGVLSGITLWGSILFISSGALSVATANNSNFCVMKAALGLNVASAVAAGLALILLAVDLILGSMSSYTRDLRNGINGVLFIFSLLELIISICTSVFACKATSYTATTVMYSQPMYSQPMNAQPVNPQPTYSQSMNPQPMYSQSMNPQPMYSQSMNPQAMYSQSMNPQPMNAQPMYSQSMNPQPMYSQSMNPQPMYNPAFYNSQESSVATCKL